ncbi:spondin-1-like isoform X3 [Zootermopsis nevadensis]|uniref:spondin-1-like isoform X3 n=1 Tax=Zootermopsis nevadensis TaxID=136037 RepID=UPI000B8EE134|nr:spondin-1-like isoform X3 [Zootermopsis nevadensis]
MNTFHKMRGGAQLVTCLLLVSISQSFCAFRCDREPEGHMPPKSEADYRFKIHISGNPDKYEPGEIYTVNLKGERILQSPQKFTGFMLVVEPWVDGPLRGMVVPVNDYNTRNVGVFNLFGDTSTKFSDRCPNAVIQTSSIPKSDVQVLWTAPPKGSGCVAFRATVVENSDFWYMDDGPLSRLLCEAVEDNDDNQPEVVNPCCACDEAKYEVTFEGLWSRHTHPKDFPTGGLLTRFSDVIGASHSADYWFWDYGSFASEGLRQVAERGATRMLESELKAQSEHIRTIIKARGISYPNVTRKTFAVFRVDRKHHLMSIVSKIDPSPDWIVGVSRLELCLRNCSWVEHKVLNLYPYDAGTDSGIAYISPDMPTKPRETIRNITSTYPNDPKSPFYGEEMKPLARLYLTRQRLYEKSCSDDTSGGTSDDDSVLDEHTVSGDCEVNEWGPWSACSVSCGKGVKYKQRSYMDTTKAQIRSCNIKLTAKYPCHGAHETCSFRADDALTDAPLDSICIPTEWNSWSSCSVTCGRGVRTRSRKYEQREAYKRCSSHPKSPRLEQNVVCYGVEGETCGDFAETSKTEKPNCPLTEWSVWSPCSATCGKGKRIRTRLRVVYNEETRTMYEYMEEGHNGPLSMKDCADVQIKDEVECDGEFPSCEITPSMAREICQMAKDEGLCTGNNSRWYFDSQAEACLQFSYSGCRGNRNRFESQEECERICQQYKEELKANRTARLHHYGVSLSGVISYRLHGHGRLDQKCEGEEEDIAIITTESPALHAENFLFGPNMSSHTQLVDAETDVTVINCVVARWSPWSACSVTCGRGVKTKTRTIKVQAKNGGKPCPKKLKRKKKCKRNCVQPIDCVLSEWSSWSLCSHTCGMNAMRQRTRSVATSSSGGGLPCGSRLEVIPCELLPCND